MAIASHTALLFGSDASRKAEEVLPSSPNAAQPAANPVSHNLTEHLLVNLDDAPRPQGAHQQAGGGPTCGPLLLTEREAAATLAISPRTLWGLRNSGEIPCVRVGRAVRYDRRDLEAWVNSRRSAKAVAGNNVSHRTHKGDKE